MFTTIIIILLLVFTIFVYLIIVGGSLNESRYDKDLEDSLKLCDFIINNDINNEKAYYFKAYINKDKEDFDNLISTYKQICVYKHIESLDPLEIIEWCIKNDTSFLV